MTAFDAATSPVRLPRSRPVRGPAAGGLLLRRSGPALLAGLVLTALGRGDPAARAPGPARAPRALAAAALAARLGAGLSRRRARGRGRPGRGPAPAGLGPAPARRPPAARDDRGARRARPSRSSACPARCSTAASSRAQHEGMSATGHALYEASLVLLSAGTLLLALPTLAAMAAGAGRRVRAFRSTAGAPLRSPPSPGRPRRSPCWSSRAARRATSPPPGPACAPPTRARSPTRWPRSRRSSRSTGGATTSPAGSSTHCAAPTRASARRR